MAHLLGLDESKILYIHYDENKNARVKMLLLRKFFSHWTIKKKWLNKLVSLPQMPFSFITSVQKWKDDRKILSYFGQMIELSQREEKPNIEK